MNILSNSAASMRGMEETVSMRNRPRAGLPTVEEEVVVADEEDDDADDMTELT